VAVEPASSDKDDLRLLLDGCRRRCWRLREGWLNLVEGEVLAEAGPRLKCPAEALRLCKRPEWADDVLVGGPVSMTSPICKGERTCSILCIIGVRVRVYRDQESRGRPAGHVVHPSCCCCWLTPMLSEFMSRP